MKTGKYKKNILPDGEANTFLANIHTALGGFESDGLGEGKEAFDELFNEKWELFLQWVCDIRVQAQLIDAILDGSIKIAYDEIRLQWRNDLQASLLG
jgi:hypothetical protein